MVPYAMAAEYPSIHRPKVHDHRGGQRRGLWSKVQSSRRIGAWRRVSYGDETVPIMVKGTLLAESLRIGASIEIAGLRVTRIARVDTSGSAKSGQPDVWTLIEFEAADDAADPLADTLARSLLVEGGWYADFTVGDEHVVVFAERVFRYRRGDQKRRAEAESYGRSVGVPQHQLDWTD